MSIQLYVSNLCKTTDAHALAQLFRRYGPIRSTRVVLCEATGLATGTAFVEMERDSDGAAAVEWLHGREHFGQHLTVRKATFRDEQDASRTATAPQPRDKKVGESASSPYAI